MRRGSENQPPNNMTRVAEIEQSYGAPIQFMGYDDYLLELATADEPNRQQRLDNELEQTLDDPVARRNIEFMTTSQQQNYSYIYHLADGIFDDYDPDYWIPADHAKLNAIRNYWKNNPNIRFTPLGHAISALNTTSNERAYAVAFHNSVLYAMNGMPVTLSFDYALTPTDFVAICGLIDGTDDEGRNGLYELGLNVNAATSFPQTILNRIQEYWNNPHNTIPLRSQIITSVGRIS